MKKKNNKKVQSNSASDMLIDFSKETEEVTEKVTEEATKEVTEEATKEVTEEAIAEEVRASLAKDVQSTLVEQENAKEDSEEEDESGPTFIEIPNEGNSNIVVGTFLYTPSEEVGKALKKDRKEKRKKRKLQEKQQKKAQKQERLQQERLQQETPYQKETAPKKSAVLYVIPAILLVLIVGAAIGLYVYERGLVYSVVHVEAGISVDVADLLVKEDENAYFTEDSEAYDMAVPGEYHLKIHTGGFDHKCTLFVEDTTAPVVKAKEILDVEYGKACEPADFMESIKDATATTVSFVNQPDYSNMEEQDIELTVTDLGNNVVTVQSVLRVSRVVTYLELEAGSKAPTARDFMISATDAVGTILTDFEEIDFGKVGEYPIQIEVEGVTYNSVIAVVDTIPPVFETKDIEGYALVKREAADFVVEDTEYEYEQIVDDGEVAVGDRLGDTEVTYTFETEPDVTKIGTQTLTIIGTDEGGNTCTRTANLTLKEDTEEPTIAGGDFTVYLGDSISYKSQVSIKDNCMDDLDVKVDTSKVNTAAEGTYPVTYTVTDAAGHSATLTVNMTIKEHTYDINELNEMADGIIKNIITADMSQYDKAWAVFSYIRGHVGYVSESEKGDWVKAAYEGLNSGKGDCYVYASVSKLLLTRAGITNMDIERIPSGNSMHYWNLVDIGDGHGWYHFDTTPRKDHPTIFLWDDATIKEYSDSHNNCHNYDRTKYPTIN